MLSKMYKVICFLVILMSTTRINAYKINITNFDNCDDHEEISELNQHAVLLTEVRYDYVDGFCDTVHGNYSIRTVDTDNNELLMTMYKCPLESTGKCSDNALEFVQHLTCKQFREDKTGPWYMISSAMSEGKCGEMAGDFWLSNATLKPEYLTKYVTNIHENSRHRMRMLFNKIKSETARIVRGCLNVEFMVFGDA